MLKHALIRKYLDDQEVYAVIGHDILVYLKIAGWYLFFLVLIYLLYMVLQRYIISHAYLMRTAALMWICIYFKWLYDIADEYLDSLVVTNKGLVLFKRNWLFDYKTDYLQWVSIESLSDEQNSFRDTLFKKWDISIKLEDERIRFKEVGHPWEKVHMLLHWKTKILWRYEYHENETTKEISRDKYELLVEALWEVVTEYVEQKKEQY
jgi:hypothetical protein